MKVGANRFADGLNVGYEKKGEREVKDELKVFGLTITRWNCHSLRMGSKGRGRFAGIWNQDFSSGHIKPQCLLGTQVEIPARKVHI